MYTIKEMNNTMILNLIDMSGDEFEYIIKKDEWGDLVICYLDHIEKVTRYDNLCDIIEDREYIIKCLENNDKSGDYGNLFEDIVYGKHFKGDIHNHKIDIESDSTKYQTTFNTFLGKFIIQNDLNIEIQQLNIMLDENTYIGTFNNHSPYIILGGLNIAKMKTEVEKYLNEFSENNYNLDSSNVERELIKMIMRLFPNHDSN